jgi:hypothetical protein
MAFIYLRRSRNTRNYLLVENFRGPNGKTSKRTLCHLGREQDGTDTLEKALLHWQKARQALLVELRSAKGERLQILKRRRKAIETRLGIISGHIAEQTRRAAAAEAERLRREIEMEEAIHWQAIERLRRQPSRENQLQAKRAFRSLAKRYHPDHGGSHEAFIRLGDAYDRAMKVFQAYEAA